MTLTNHQIAYIINVKPIITFNMKKIIFILIAVLGMSTTSFAQSDKEMVWCGRWAVGKAGRRKLGVECGEKVVNG